MGNSSTWLALFDEKIEQADALELKARQLEKDVLRYRVKTIKSGPILECEIYPIWSAAAAKRARTLKPTRKAQENLNNRNMRRKVERYINNNFTSHDLWVTFTYSAQFLPQSFEEAKRDVSNYFRRVARRHKKRGLPPLRYLYVIEYKEGATRFHVHIVMSGDLSRDEVESLWKGGARRHARRLQPDANGFAGLANYLTKAPKDQRRWGHSQNLNPPKVTTSDYKISKRKAKTMAFDQKEAPLLLEQVYQGYDYLEMEGSTSSWMPGVYIYAKLGRRQSPCP